MFFNSINFAIFLPIIFILYWSVFRNNNKSQNLVLLIASYIFYGWWDWRFLLLLIFMSVSNYIIGLLISRNRGYGNYYFALGLIINLGVLIYFKYYNFFIDGFIDFISLLGYKIKSNTINIILPLGISFYTFLSLSYIIDVYKNKIKVSNNIIDLLLSLSFFPIILSGPIERPASLIPQLKIKREFDYTIISDGLRQILWGLFAKVVIADGITNFTTDIFTNHSEYTGSTLLFGAFLYTIQIYADFSGYSDIAIGVSKLFGIKIIRNFAYPYFSRDITIFWKRWHISLTNWFRDYVFLPTAYAISRKIKKEKVFFIKSDYIIYIIGILITWTLTGLWHGANYTYIIWGMFHAILLIIYHLQKKPRKKILKRLNISNNSSVLVFIETIITLFLISLSWVIFNSNHLKDSLEIINNIFSMSFFTYPVIDSFNYTILIYILIYFIIEWMQKEKNHGLELSNTRIPLFFRYAIYYILIIFILIYSGAKQEFIYFQF